MTEPKLWSFYTNDPAPMLSGGCIALARPDAFDLSTLCATRDAFRASVNDVVEANLLYRFAHEVREGDFVLLRSGHGRPVDIGRVTGDYAFDGGEHRRKVRWIKRMTPDDISGGAMREITYASASPLFEVRRHAAEFLAALGLNPRPVPVGASHAERFAERWGYRSGKSA